MPQRRYKSSRTPGYKYATRENLNTASKALSVALQVKKLINVEYKNIVTNFTNDPNTTGSVVNLSAIAQSNTIAGRQGQKVRAKHLSCRGHIIINASATATQIRMVIVRDNLGSTTAPAISDLYASVSLFFANKSKNGDPQSNARFSVLMDKFVMLDAIYKSQVGFHWSRSLDSHISFTGTGATDEGKGAFYLMIASSEATNDPQVDVDSVLKFIDN